MPTVLPRTSLRRGHGAREERIGTRRSGRREDVRPRAPEEPLNLFPSVANRRRGCNDLRLHLPAVDLPHEQRFDRRLVKAGHGPQRIQGRKLAQRRRFPKVASNVPQEVQYEA